MSGVNRRFYWLRLWENFFEEDTIKLIENMENGKDYLIFLLKLRLKAINSEGYLYFKDIMPYSESMLATITNTNIDIVKSALTLFEQLGLVTRMDDGTLYMEQVEKLIGSETQSTIRTRRQRQKEKLEQKNNQLLPEKASQWDASETQPERNVDGEIETEIEYNTLDNKVTDQVVNSTQPTPVRKKEKAQEIVDLYHEYCPSLPRVKVLSDKRIKHINTRLKDYSKQTLAEAFKIAEASDFLTARDGRSNTFTCNIDWLINENNLAKVLEGNYNNKKSKKKSKPLNPTHRYVDETPPVKPAPAGNLKLQQE